MNFTEVRYPIEVSEKEKLAVNIMSYFLEKQDYAIFNFQEKILENFNHDYFNIIYIYTEPLINDVNIESFLDKINLMKKLLRKKFFLFHQSILVIALNCSLDMTKITLPKDVDVVCISDKESLAQNEIINFFPDLLIYPLDLNFDSLAKKLTFLSYKYTKRLSSIFNKKSFIISIILVVLILALFTYSLYVDISPLLLLTKGNVQKYHFYTFITNSFIEFNLIWLLIDVFFIITFGRRIEKIYGSLRYLIIIILAIIFSNTLNFALKWEYYGFTPIIYAFIGMFTYNIIVFRRYFAHMIKRLLILTSFTIILMLIFNDFNSIIQLLANIIIGVILGFIVGIPKVKNGKIRERFISLFLFLIIITLLISLGF